MTDKTPVDRLVDLMEFHVESGVTLRGTATKIAEAIQADPLAYVKPKPLEWADHSTTRMWATTGMKVYEIILWEEIDGYDRTGFEYAGKLHPTLEAAQAAAYDDLCNRVKELF